MLYWRLNSIVLLCITSLNKNWDMNLPHPMPHYLAWLFIPLITFWWFLTLTSLPHLISLSLHCHYNHCLPYQQLPNLLHTPKKQPLLSLWLLCHIQQGNYNPSRTTNHIPTSISPFSMAARSKPPPHPHCQRAALRKTTASEVKLLLSTNIPTLSHASYLQSTPTSHTPGWLVTASSPSNRTSCLCVGFVKTNFCTFDTLSPTKRCNYDDHVKPTKCINNKSLP